MHTEAKISGVERTQFGSLKTKKLRASGYTPGNIYGHGQPNLNFSVKSDELETIIRSGTKVMDLTVGGTTEKALLLEVQWDTFGTHIRHFDLQRVDPNEKIHVEVPIEIKGTAAGVLSGGVLEQPLHTLNLECLAYLIPNTFLVKVADLQVGQSLHVKELEVPEGISILNDPDEVVIHIVKVAEVEIKTEAAEGGATQPEIVGRKVAEEAAPAEDAKKKK